jgi:hypothetical protein
LHRGFGLDAVGKTQHSLKRPPFMIFTMLG